jgi:exodeoxyribonuclease VII large subunit
MGIESGDQEPAETTRESLTDTLGTENVAFVDELNNEIASVIEASDAGRFDYVVGDVSDYSVSSAGHAHFDLVHGDASIHCVVFAFKLSHLDVEIEDGTQVAVKGDLSFYEEGGTVSIIVEDVVDIGEGEYQQLYEQNKQTLAEDGLLDEEAKQPLPEFPRRIGIVTSADSDAREDAVTSIHGHHHGVDIVIHDTAVQGDDAMLSILQGVSQLDDDARIDVIVVTRGGGADKHLRVFNETPLCRVIHNVDTPVVVGVGHESDRTLADEVADRRVMTPTHVGEIVPERDVLLEEIEAKTQRLDGAYGRLVSSRLDTVATELELAYEQRVAGELGTLETDLDHAFESLASEQLTEYGNRLDHSYESLVDRRLSTADKRLDQSYESLVTERLTALDNRLDHALESLEQAKVHEEETAEAVAEYEQSTRRQRVAIAVLVVLVLGLLAYIHFL